MSHAEIHAIAATAAAAGDVAPAFDFSQPAVPATLG